MKLYTIDVDTDNNDEIRNMASAGIEMLINDKGHVITANGAFCGWIRNHEVTEGEFSGMYSVAELADLHAYLDNGETFSDWLADMIRMDLVRVKGA